jgi:hypothetical protein
MILHFSQIGFTDGRTFIWITPVPLPDALRGNPFGQPIICPAKRSFLWSGHMATFLSAPYRRE